MATTFSWSDTFHIAFSTCLPCLSKPANLGSSASTESLHDPSVAHRIPRARADELQGLLADSDAEVERMSLHSNPGRKKKRSKRKQNKRITLFGYDLFGHAPPPIQLPESDDEDGNRGPGAPTPPTRSSSLTFDSDAAPIDSSAIASASAAALRAREEADEVERRERAERRERRRRKKELKRAAKALALAEQGEDFEGFQGSGSGLRPEDYGPFIHAGPRENDEDIDEDVDLDGGMYASRRNTGTSFGSDSRSRTSASRSQQSQSDQPFPQQRLQLPEIIGPIVPRTKKTKSKSSTASRSTTSRASRSNTSISTYQSPSLLSPASPTFYEGDLPFKSKFNVAEDFDGSQGLVEADLPLPGIRGRFPSPGLRGGFPSPGLTEFPGSGFPNIDRRDSLLTKGGAFLAIRGGVDDLEG